MYNARQDFSNQHRDSRGSRPSARLTGMPLALAAAIAVLLALPTAPTAAQAAEVTLVSNADQTKGDGTFLLPGFPLMAAKFTTGANSQGYKPTSFGFLLGDPLPGAGLTVTLNESATVARHRPMYRNPADAEQ